MKLPIRFFLGELLTFAGSLLVFSRQKAENLLEVTGKALTQRQAIVVLNHALHKVLKQADWK
jgi:hypothetical protein